MPRRSTSRSWRSIVDGWRSWSRTATPQGRSSRTTATSASGRASTTSTCRPSTNRTSRSSTVPAASSGSRPRARSSAVGSTPSTASSTAPASRPSSPRCPGGPAHEIIGRGGISLAERWRDGAASLFGMMTRGFPNLFVMPAPGQQAVVTVNYTQLAVLGAEFVGRAVGILEERGVAAFDVSARAEDDWTQQVVDSFIDASQVMAACTPSRLNMEGHPERMNPRNGNYGRGLGDYFGYRRILRDWLDQGRCEGPRARRGHGAVGRGVATDGRRAVAPASPRRDRHRGRRGASGPPSPRSWDGRAPSWSPWIRWSRWTAPSSRRRPRRPRPDGSRPQGARRGPRRSR